MSSLVKNRVCLSILPVIQCCSLVASFPSCLVPSLCPFVPSFTSSPQKTHNPSKSLSKFSGEPWSYHSFCRKILHSKQKGKHDYFLRSSRSANRAHGLYR